MKRSSQHSRHNFKSFAFWALIALTASLIAGPAEADRLAPDNAASPRATGKAPHELLPSVRPSVLGSLLFASPPATLNCNSPVQSSNAPGDLEPGFGTGGKVTTDFAGTSDRATGVAQQPDGKFVVVGHAGSSDNLFIARYEANGNLDPTFGNGGKVVTNLGQGNVTEVEQVALQADGKLVVVGQHLDSSLRDSSLFVARFLTNGIPDASFNSDGVAFESFGFFQFAGGRGDLRDTARAVAIQPDGMILVGGSGSSAGTNDDSEYLLGRYTASGQRDPSFGTDNGYAKLNTSPRFDELINEVLLQPDGRILVAGGSHPGDGNLGNVARYNTNGILDATFGTAGVVGSFPLTAAVLQPDGKIVIGGNSLSSSETLETTPRLTRLNNNGSYDLSLNVANRPFFPVQTIEFINDVAVLPNGKIIVAGKSYDRTNTLTDDFALSVHNPDGEFDRSFGNSGMVTTGFGGTTDTASAMVLEGFGRILLAGRAGGDAGLASYEAPSQLFDVSFSASTYNTHETAGAATVTVRLGVPSTQTVTVNYATSDGTATAGSDYLSQSSMFTFAPGETTKTFDVPIISDSQTEFQPETVLLSLSNPTNAVVGRPATLLISDNPYLSFGRSNYSVLESMGVASVNVYLNAASSLPVTMDYASADGTATQGSDYTAVNGTLTFTPGETVKSVDVPLIADATDEPDETLVLTLSNASNASINQNNPTTITIVGNVSSCTACETVTVGEKENFANVAITAVEAGTVQYETSDGTATAGSDYTSISGTLHFTGQGTQVIQVPIHRDLVYDPDETITVLLRSTTELSTGPLVVVRIADASIVVNSFEQNQGGCTLTRAIQAANQDLVIGECEKGDGTDNIHLPAGTYTLTAVNNTHPRVGPVGLPLITTDVVIGGAGAANTIIERDPNAGALFVLMALTDVSGGSLVLNDVTMRGGRVGGGPSLSGGGVYIGNRTATFNNVTFNDNSANHGGAVGSFGGAMIANHCTFTNNRATGSGGAIEVATVTVTHSTFSDNTAANGGALYFTQGGSLSDSTFINNRAITGAGGAINFSGTTTITRSYFDGNTADSEGGAIKTSGVLDLVDTVVSRNRASSGGGIATASTLNVTGTKISSNVASTHFGGGILFSGAGAGTIENSTISDNTAGLRGGGVYNSSSTLTLNNLTVANNTAFEGGGLYFQGNSATANINNSTIAGNHALSYAGGIWRASGSGSTSINLKNTILAFNTAAGFSPDAHAGVGGISSLGYNLIGDGSNANIAAATGDQIGSANNPVNPLLGPLQQNGGVTETLALQPGSPAIDVANPGAPGSGGDACLATDQRERPRPGGARCDIGAFERDAFAPVADLIINQTVLPTPAHVGCPLTYRINVSHSASGAASVFDNVIVTDVLTAGMTFVSATPTQGTCSESGGIVTCNLGSIAADATASIDIIVTPNASGVFRNTATVSSSTTEANTANNTSTATVKVSTPINVNTTAQNPGASGDCTLGEAIQAANSDAPVDGCAAGSGDDLILVPAGLYTLNTIDPGSAPERAGLPAITTTMTIQGAGATLTVIDRGSATSFRHMWIGGFASFTLNDVTLRNGHAAGEGGGSILSRFDRQVRLNNCIFESNRADGSGGAVSDFNGSSITVNNCSFTGNTAAAGGAINSSGVLSISNSTFSNNSSAGQSGAISCSSTTTISNSSFTGNQAGGGGGAIGGGAIVKLTSTIFDRNTTAHADGGAVLAGTTGSLDLNDSSFTNNTAPLGSGGAVSCTSCSIAGSNFAGNSSNGEGGAILISGGSSSITNSTISGNRTNINGGGVKSAFNMSLVNVTIANNTAGSQGGGAFFTGDGKTVDLNNVTIANNHAVHSGGGFLRNNGVGFGDGIVRMKNSIVALNTGVVANPDIYANGPGLISLGHNLVGNIHSSALTPATGDQIGTTTNPINPLLGQLQSNGGPTQTLALLAGSPAVDAANPAVPGTNADACANTDQRGVARPMDGNGDGIARCDMGAYEAQALAIQADLSVTKVDTPDPVTVGDNLTYTMTVTNNGPSSATGIVLTDTLPDGLSLVSLTTSQGRYTQPDNRLIVNLDSLVSGASATVSLVVKVRRIGTIDNTVNVSGNESDPNTTNNSAMSSSTITPSPTVSVSTITPNRGGNKGPILVVIKGVGFVQGTKAKLVKTGQPDIVGNTVSFAENSLAVGVFLDLTGKELGDWDVVVTNPDGSSVTLSNGFAIEVGSEPNVWVEVLGRDNVRPGTTHRYTIVIGNSGNGDFYGFPLFLASSSSVNASPLFAITAPPVEALETPIDFNLVPTSTTSGDGTKTVFPLFIPVLRAHSTETLSLSVRIPLTGGATSFEIGATATKSLVGGSAGTVPGNSAMNADTANSAENICPLNPENDQCVTALMTELTNVAGAVPGLGCAYNVAIALLGRIPGTCAFIDSVPTPGEEEFEEKLFKFIGMSHLQIFAGTASLAGSCLKNFSGVGNLANLVSLITGFIDLYRECSGEEGTLDSFNKRITIVFSNDPNEKIGPTGTGDSRFITDAEPMPYAVYFENKAEATAPAQTVVITDQLDPAKHDLSTFSLGPMTFGDKTVVPPQGLSDYTADVDLRPSNDLIVRVAAHLNQTTGGLSWRFTSLDPATGLPTDDALAGFLPPNVHSPEGQGSVMYFVSPKQGLATGTEIRNRARIVFDLNNPIDTNEWLNTIDKSNPMSHALSLAPQQSSSSFQVTWSGTDTGSGVKDYTIFVSKNNGPFVEWLSKTTSTSGIYHGQPDTTYAFYSVARDNTKNQEGSKTTAEATTTTPPTASQFSLTRFDVSENAGSATITVTRMGSISAASTVDFATSNGTAVAGRDHISTAGTLNFATGETSKTFAIQVINNSVADGKRAVNLTLSNPTAGDTLSYPSTAVLDITDDDGLASTQTGAPVTVNLGNITVTFTSVTSAGVTGANPADPNSQGVPPTGLTITGPAYYIGTTATYSGPINVCFNLPSVTDEANFNRLRVLRREGGILVDRTTSHNFQTKMVCSSVTSLSPFVIAQTPPSYTAQFSASAYNVAEGGSSALITVTRTGDLANAATVDYATNNGTASERSDYTTAVGTLRFAAGDSTETFTVLLTDDRSVEPDETLNITLSNPTGGGALGIANVATLTITSNDTSPPAANPIDEAQFIVERHYHDFLNREPDASGLAFWTDQITSCGADAQCREIRRINVSAAFFLSIEFQQTGYLVYRAQQAAFDTGPTLGFRDFLRDTQEIGRGVVVGQAGWEQKLEANKQAFFSEFVNRQQFLARYPLTLTPAQYVDALNANTGGSLTQVWLDALVAGLTAGTETRATVMRAVSEDTDFRAREFNRAFVFMQYLGYLRRDPDDSPDTNLDGYNFWLTKLNQFNGNFIEAEMVKAFINSGEYRGRFGP